jgi:hypothetical protein
MDVFAFYDCSIDAPANQAAMVTLWERGWRNRGWNPRLITIRHARRSKFYAKCKTEGGYAEVPQSHLLALHAAGGGLLTPLNIMNFDMPVLPKALTSRAPFVAFGCGAFWVTRLALEKFFKSRNPTVVGPGTIRACWCSIHGKDKMERWSKSPLVYFSNPEEALHCGRPL